MIRLTHRLDGTATPTHTLTLTLEQRARSRLRVTLDDGSPAGLFLDRGHVLRDGDCVAGDDGVVALVRAAAETVSTVRSEDPVRLARACYHLGNRHVPLQIGAGLVRYRHDHVLDALVRGLGLSVVVEQAPFEPESGAYGAGHDHGHGHGHGHAA
jgi:urease accessory protein